MDDGIRDYHFYFLPGFMFLKNNVGKQPNLWLGLRQRIHKSGHNICLILLQSRIFYFYPESKKKFPLHRLSLDKLYLEPSNTENILGHRMQEETEKKNR